jgi:hypothetical protein
MWRIPDRWQTVAIGVTRTVVPLELRHTSSESRTGRGPGSPLPERRRIGSVWAGASPPSWLVKLVTAPRELIRLASLSFAFDAPRENRQ